MNELDKFESGESIYDAAFREKLNALVDAVNDITKLQAQQGQQPDSRISRAMLYGIPARLTGHASTAGEYEFEEVWTAGDGKTWAVKAGGLTHTELGNARCRGMWTGGAGGIHVPLVGRIVYLRPSPASLSSKRVWDFELPISVVPIKLTQTGGGSGSFTTQCNFTYTVADVDNQANLDTAVDPTASPHLYARPSYGAMNAATWGIAYYGTDVSDNPEFRILYINETPNYAYEECST